MLNVSGRKSTAPPRTLAVARQGEPRPGKPFVISLTLHIAAALAVAYASQAHSHQPLPRFRPARTTIVYVPIVPIVPVEMATIKLVELRAPEPVNAEEPAPALPSPEVAPVFESRRVDVLKPVELPEEPTPAPPPTRKAEVAVGTFDTTAAPARIPEAARQIEIAGFDRQAISGPAKSGPSLGIGSPIADAGFNRSSVVMAAAAPEGRVIRDTGFGNTNSREKPRTTETPVEVTPVMFNNGRAAQGIARAAAAPPAPRITPVEVLSKPTPVYTEEARRLRIEGDVLLEVEFSCTGTIRILRVVRGLGYGLDEAAVRAAQQIRFKPAQDSGQAVDSRVTVNIVFRLA